MSTNATGNAARWNVQDTNGQLPQGQQAHGDAAQGDAAHEGAAQGDAAQGAEASQSDEGSDNSSPSPEQEARETPMDSDTGVPSHTTEDTFLEEPSPELLDDAYHQVRAQMAYHLEQAKAWNIKKGQILRLKHAPKGDLTMEQVADRSTHVNLQLAKANTVIQEAMAEYRSLKEFLDFEREMMAHEPQEAMALEEGQTLNPSSQDTDIYPDDSDRIHQALVRIYKYKKIPVIQGTKRVDWPRVTLCDHKGAPVFQLELKGVAKEKIAFVSVKAIVEFLRDFERFYKDNLTDLFEYLAWKYMYRALTPSGLHQRFEESIGKVPLEKRNWQKVKNTIKALFKLRLMQNEILKELSLTEIQKGETAECYAERIELLFQVTDMPNMGPLVIAKIMASLSDEGQEKVIAKFQDFELIPDLTSLLQFIRETPSIVKGTKADPFAWIVTKFGTKYPTDRGSSLSEQSDSIGESSSTASRPSPVRQNQQPTRRNQGRTFRKATPYNRDSRAGPSVPAREGDKCKSPICRRLGRKHTDALCFRHSDMAKFDGLNKKAGYKPMGFQKGPKAQGNPPDRLAAIKDHDMPDHQDNWFYDTIGSRMDYNEDDMISDYTVGHGGMIRTGKRSIDSSEDAAIINTGKALKLTSHFSGVVPNFLQPPVALRNQTCSIDANNPSPSLLPRQTGYRGPEEGDNRLAVPIMIQGRKYTALVDSGSTHSIIDKVLARDLRIRCSTLMNKAIEMGETGMLVKKTITNDRIHIVCNGRTVEWQVSVLNLGYYDFLIGMDLFPRLGFQLAGFELSKQPRDDIYVIEEKPSIVSPDPTTEEQRADFIKRKETFMRMIDGALQRNATIDPRSHCPLDIMRVELKTKEGCVIQERSRRFYSETERTEVDATVKKWIDNGIVVPAPKGNPYNNSLTLAARRNLEGVVLKYRVCLDPRKLNRQLIDTDNFPLPIINDILERVAGHKYFTTIDLSQAYHRLPLDEKSQPYTAFTYNNLQYMFARAPFGLKPMTSIFQRGMAQILGDLHFVAVYVDDIVIFSNTMEEHLEHVNAVIERLTKARLIINKEKSHFLRTQVVLLGFLVDANGKRINPEKVANVKTWAPPTNGKMIQRYLGMFNYFREYIPLYSTISAPLDRLRNVKGNFTLGELEMKCFEQLKRLVTEAPVLSFPDFNQPFYVATDASNLGIGAVLYQLPNGPQDESKVNYISFMARSLKPHEKNYPAYKKELLGVIYACKKFHYYLWGRKFTLYTDHRPLTYINEQNELPQILADWKETLFSYDFDCIYRPGLLNIIPDALSRAFPDELWTTKTGKRGVQANDDSKVAAVATRNFRRQQQQSNKPTDHPETLMASVESVEEPDETLPDLPTEPINQAPPVPEMVPEPQIVPVAPHGDRTPETHSNTAAGTPVTSSEMAEQLAAVPLDPNAAYLHEVLDQSEYRQVTSKDEQDKILHEVHSFGHPGANAMVTKIHQQGTTWPKLKEACITWIRQCSACQHFSIVRKGYHPLKAIHATLPGEHIAMDLAQFDPSNRGNVYALIVVDVCSRFVFLRPLKEKTALTVAELLYELFCLIGFPKIIQSDQGSEFENDLLRTLTKKCSIDKRATTPYHPQGNGLAERNVRTMKDILKKELEGKIADWDLHLPRVQLIMNTRVASLHGSTPFSLFYGRPFPGFEDFRSVDSRLATPDQLRDRLEYLTKLVYPAVSEKSKRTQKRMIEKFNASHYITEFPDGSFVMAEDELASSKGAIHYEGPYIVVRRTSLGSYVIKDRLGNEMKRRFAPDQLKHAAAPSEDDTHYEVEYIHSHRTDEEDGQVYYMCKFKGYDMMEEINYDGFDSKSMVHKYYKDLNQDNPHVVAKRARITAAAAARAAKKQKKA
jgi:hypothetical protein